MNEVKKIMVPVDFSGNSQKILQSAVMLAGKFQARLSVVFVVQSFDDYSGFFVPHIPISQFEEEMLQAAQRKMTAFVAENLTAAVPYDAKVLQGDVANEILRYAEEAKIDLIVMGTHGYKGLEKVLFGSVAEKVVKMASCPVLTINPYR